MKYWTGENFRKFRAVSVFVSVVIFLLAADSAFAAGGADCVARTGRCSTGCIEGGFLGNYDCPASAPMCCGDPSAANKVIFGEGGLNPFGSSAQNTKTSIFSNPLGQNMGTIDQVLSGTSGYLNAVAGTIAIIFVLIGSAFYVVAAFGKKEMAELGKKMIVVAVGGLAVVVGAPYIWKEIKNILGGGDPAQLVQTSPAANIVMNTLKGFLYLVGLYAILGFLIGGIAYFISFGDEKRQERAKTILKFAIIGDLIAIGALVIASQIVRLLGG